MQSTIVFLKRRIETIYTQSCYSKVFVDSYHFDAFVALGVFLVLFCLIMIVALYNFLVAPYLCPSFSSV